MKIVILKNPVVDCSRWETACENLKVKYQLIDTSKSDFLDKIASIRPDFCLARSSGITQYHKKIYDEKIFAIERFLNIPVFPSYNEIILHENKIMLNFFLKANHLLHPRTFVSFDRAECISHSESVKYPVVAKTASGAAGSGVRIISNITEAQKYIAKAFSSGIRRRYGPNKRSGNALSWMQKAWQSPQYLKRKLLQYKLRRDDVHKGYILFQEFIDHDYEWRCVKIGDSYFAYKKLKLGDKASGAKIFDYGAPPVELLDFMKNLCNKQGFNFMAADLFYTNGKIYINELQTLFGHKSQFICQVNGKSGRYVFKNNSWKFEAGTYNTNESYDLRLKTALDICS